MKKLSCFLLLLLLLSCSQKNMICIEGELENGNGRMIYLSILTADGLQTIDSVVVRHNNFRFKLPTGDDKLVAVGQPAFLQLSFSPDNGLTTLARSGETVHITANANKLVSSYRVTGPEDAMLMWKLDSALSVFVQYTDNLLQIYNYYMDEDSVRGKVEQSYNRAVEMHQQYLKDFILAHPYSFSTMIAFYQGYNNRRFFDETENADLLRKLTESLAEYYPNSQYVKYLQSRCR